MFFFLHALSLRLYEKFDLSPVRFHCPYIGETREK